MKCAEIFDIYSDQSDYKNDQIDQLLISVSILSMCF